MTERIVPSPHPDYLYVQVPSESYPKVLFHSAATDLVGAAKTPFTVRIKYLPQWRLSQVAIAILNAREKDQAVNDSDDDDSDATIEVDKQSYTQMKRDVLEKLEYIQGVVADEFAKLKQVVVFQWAKEDEERRAGGRDRGVGKVNRSEKPLKKPSRTKYTVDTGYYHLKEDQEDIGDDEGDCDGECGDYDADDDSIDDDNNNDNEATLVFIDQKTINNVGGLVMQSYWRKKLGWQGDKSKRSIEMGEKYQFFTIQDVKNNTQSTRNESEEDEFATISIVSKRKQKQKQKQTKQPSKPISKSKRSLRPSTISSSTKSLVQHSSTHPPNPNFNSYLNSNLNMKYMWSHAQGKWQLKRSLAQIERSKREEKRTKYINEEIERIVAMRNDLLDRVGFLMPFLYPCS